MLLFNSSIVEARETEAELAKSKKLMANSKSMAVKPLRGGLTATQVILNFTNGMG